MGGTTGRVPSGTGSRVSWEFRSNCGARSLASQKPNCEFFLHMNPMNSDEDQIKRKIRELADVINRRDFERSPETQMTDAHTGNCPCCPTCPHPDLTKSAPRFSCLRSVFHRWTAPRSPETKPQTPRVEAILAWNRLFLLRSGVFPAWRAMRVCSLPTYAPSPTEW